VPAVTDFGRKDDRIKFSEDGVNMSLTPMMQQYLDVKSQHQDAILFFRLGDFYEMFFDDAKTVSSELELVLTGKDCGMPERAPMCGIPYHSADSYISRLVANGHKVVICEQMEDASLAKGLVKRDVIRIVTPGTVIDSGSLDDRSNNYLCSIYFDMSEKNTVKAAGLCFADVSTGEVVVTEIDGDNCLRRVFCEVGTYSPREVLINIDSSLLPAFVEFLNLKLRALLGDKCPERFDIDAARRNITEKRGKALPEDDGRCDNAIRALGALLGYIAETQKTSDTNIKSIRFYSEGQYLEMDLNTRRSLELCGTMRQGEKKGSLLWVLDHTKTSMGARLLRKWIEQPLTDVKHICRRQEAVAELCNSFMLREECAELLSNVLDLERLMTKVVYGTANARDLHAIAKTLSVLPEIKQLLSEAYCRELMFLNDSLDTLEDISALLESAICDEPPLTVKEGKMIRPGYSAEVDRLRDIINNGKGYVDQMEAAEREKTGIKNLKISYNRVFGYYIEVSKSNLAIVPDEYIRKQTLTNGERYITQELKDMEATILGATDKITALEYEIFCQLREKVSINAPRIQQTADVLSSLDVYISFADTAVKYNYVCPDVQPHEFIKIKDGRHPVVERFVSDGYFVPNDTMLDTGHNRLMLITGPNMAGKSTYMRQVALIVIMAQIGSFVPAAEAEIGIVDRLFTRVGASDDLASGMSTFMTEMNEVAYILKNATRRSLIIYDEIGRGTSTFDGMSIARATAEYTLSKKIGAKTLFATHYHELTTLEDELDGVVNYSIAAKKKGDDIMFLRKIVRGGADDSYGIEVAKLAGVPNEIIKRAREILNSLESKSAQIMRAEESDKPEDTNITLGDMGAEEIAERIKKTDPELLTPREALDLIYELKKLTI